jgi:hypothetical protein
MEDAVTVGNVQQHFRTLPSILTHSQPSKTQLTSAITLDHVHSKLWVLCLAYWYGKTCYITSFSMFQSRHSQVTQNHSTSFSINEHDKTVLTTLDTSQSAKLWTTFPCNNASHQGSLLTWRKRTSTWCNLIILFLRKLIMKIFHNGRPHYDTKSNLYDLHGYTVHQWCQTLYCPTNAHNVKTWGY